jgi:hypothetical protein
MAGAKQQPSLMIIKNDGYSFSFLAEIKPIEANPHPLGYKVLS